MPAYFKSGRRGLDIAHERSQNSFFEELWGAVPGLQILDHVLGLPPLGDPYLKESVCIVESNLKECFFLRPAESKVEGVDALWSKDLDMVYVVTQLQLKAIGRLKRSCQHICPK